MVKVWILRDKERRIQAFKCEGHAGHAKSTSKFDMVCAAVSAIVYSALGYMEEYYGMNDFIEKSGFIEWKRPNEIKDSITKNISPVLDAMTVGLKQIEMQYKKNIKVIEVERNELKI